MRWLEIRRHSLTKKGPGRGHGSDLSAEGVALARRLGARMGPFERVVTSSAARTMETALAMGFAVDEVLDLPSGYVPGEVDHHDQWTWPEPYRRYAEILQREAGLARVAATVRELWSATVAAVQEGGSALVVASGGTIEPGLVSCLPDAPHEAWGAPFQHCDGARLAYDENRFVSIAFHRVSPSEKGTATSI